MSPTDSSTAAVESPQRPMRSETTLGRLRRDRRTARESRNCPASMVSPRSHSEVAGRHLVASEVDQLPAANPAPSISLNSHRPRQGVRLSHNENSSLVGPSGGVADGPPHFETSARCARHVQNDLAQVESLLLEPTWHPCPATRPES